MQAGDDEQVIMKKFYYFVKNPKFHVFSVKSSATN